MVLGDTINKSGFFKRLLYNSLIAGMFFLPGCDKSDSVPSAPSNGNNGGYVAPSGITDGNGEVGLKVGDQEFDINIKNNGGSPLSGIEVKGVDFESGDFGFKMTDSERIYFSRILYHNVYQSNSIDGQDGRINLNDKMNEIRGRSREVRIHSFSEPYPQHIFNNDRLDSIDTITLDDLSNAYQKHDAITKNIDFLEFLVRTTQRPEFSIALKLAELRQSFIENSATYNEVVNSIASLLGGSFEQQAFYMVLFKNNLDVLTHVTSRKKFVTLKGNVYGNSSQLSGARIEVVNGPTRCSTFSDNEGGYYLKFLEEGSYTFRATASGFTQDEYSKLLVFNGYIQPKCNTSDFNLNLDSGGTTPIVLQPGSEGKDTFVSNFVDEDYGNHNFLRIYDVVYGNGQVDRSLAYIKFDIPSLSGSLESAVLSLWGEINYDGEDNSLDPSIGVYRIMNSWNENMGFGEQPQSNGFPIVSASLEDETQGWINFNITSLVNGWDDGTYGNYGVKLFFNEDYGNKLASFVSSDNNVGSQRPKLTLVTRN